MGSISIDTFDQPAGNLNGEFLGGVSARIFEPLTVHNLLCPFVAVKQSETSNTLSEHIFQPKDRFQVQISARITITVTCEPLKITLISDTKYETNCKKTHRET